MLTRYKGRTALKAGTRRSRNAATSNGMVHADGLRADDMSDAALTSKDRKLLHANACRSEITSNSNRRAAERQNRSAPRMSDSANNGMQEARYLACGRSDPGPPSSGCDAAAPIRCRQAPGRIDDRSDGPQPPSISAEDCTAHQDTQAGDGSTGWFNNERTVSSSSAGTDMIENSRRKWLRRKGDLD
jgi:hypothetical protein